MTIALLLLVLALIVYGLERNHYRMSKPRPRLHGNTDAFWPY
ncbi:hypothetical protein ACFQ1S_11530 [Kibdelosporangium lantanae]|uniref:Uncharacterized protein n=1 Tax=Kibdelosporangium lantanae TaxID=1497396 RepID=A0ABW3MB20_9PSEU